MLIAIVAFWAWLFVAWLVVPDSGTDLPKVLAARIVHFAICAFGFAFSVCFWGIYRWYAIQARR